jgi:hypothetical protein
MSDRADEYKGTITIDLKVRAYMPHRSGSPGVIGTITVRVPIDVGKLGWPAQKWQIAGMSQGDYPDRCTNRR